MVILGTGNFWEGTFFSELDICIKWKQSEVVEVLNLLRGGILFLIETSGLFKFLFDVTNGFMVLTNPQTS